MSFPPDRNLARARGLWPRLIATAGLVAFSCTFPDYRFDAQPTETCDNDILDGKETGIDCGGDCDPCPCKSDKDCPGADEVCEGGDCLAPCQNGECPPTCFDKVQNGDETDVDCGGSCEAKCPIGADCRSGKDCIEKVCDETCQPPKCDDGVRNGFETWIDCGGDCEAKCANGEPCDVDDDCESDTCVETAAGQAQCAPPFCSNGKLDSGETDIDCGGRECPKCRVGDICASNRDCVEGVCGEDDKCAAPECDDKVRNGDETDVDCGGSCKDCSDGEDCRVAGDCVSGVCSLPSDCDDEDCSKQCQVPSCEDGVRNGIESDKDCGGDCEGCPIGSACGRDRDCQSGICDMSTDAPARCVSCDDGKQNGEELGIDCGGSDCELCLPGDECSADAGCVNYLCDGGECANGLTVDYHCGQCGEEPDDQIKAFLSLNNLSDEAINVSDVIVRYYFSINAPESVIDNFGLDCEFMGAFSCGAQTIQAHDPDPDSDATHYFETRIGSDELIPGGGSAVLEITIRLNGTRVNQRDDYSFAFGTSHLRWQRITLHRRGTLIWGTEP